MAVGVQSQQSYAQVLKSPPVVVGARIQSPWAKAKGFPRSPPWEAIFRIQNIQPPPSQPRQTEVLSNYLSQHVYPRPEEVLFQEEPKRMGNQSGLDPFDRLFQEIDQMKSNLNSQQRHIDSLKEHLDSHEQTIGSQEQTIGSQQRHIDSLKEHQDSQQREIVSLKEHRDEMNKNILILRVWELQQAGRRQDRETHFGAGAERNRLVHGGNVKLDLKGIESLRGTNKLPGATAGFRVLYGRHPAEVGRYFYDVPEEVVGAFNYRGDLTRLYALKNHPKQEDSVELCDKIITTWLNSMKIPGLGSQLHVIRQLYKQLMKIMPV